MQLPQASAGSRDDRAKFTANPKGATTMAADTPNNPAGASTPTADAPGSKKRRSGAERVVVWALILLGAVLCLLEARARFGYSQTLTLVAEAKAQSDKPNGAPFGLADVEKMVRFSPQKVEKMQDGKHVVIYKWSGPVTAFLDRNKIASFDYKILLTVAKAEKALDKANPEVLSYETGTEESSHTTLSLPGGRDLAPHYNEE
jgi:hypothetical protein